METFNIVHLLDKKHSMVAYAIFPNGWPSHVCVEIVPHAQTIGRVTYKRSLLLSEEDALLAALQAAFQDKWDTRLLAEPGEYAGGVLSA